MVERKKWVYTPQPKTVVRGLFIAAGLIQLYQGVLAIGESDILIGVFFVVAGLVITGLSPYVHRFNRCQIWIDNEGVSFRRGVRSPVQLRWEAVSRMCFERLRVDIESGRGSRVKIDFGQMSTDTLERLRPEICTCLREVAETKGIMVVEQE